MSSSWAGGGVGGEAVLCEEGDLDELRNHVRRSRRGGRGAGRREDADGTQGEGKEGGGVLANDAELARQSSSSLIFARLSHAAKRPDPTPALHLSRPSLTPGRWSCGPCTPEET